MAETSSSANEKHIPPAAVDDEKVIYVPGSGTRRGGIVLAKLEPYLHLLPDLSRVELDEQQKLYQALFSVGVSAAVSLHKLLNEAPAATKAKAVAEFDKSPCATIDLQEVGMERDLRNYGERLKKFRNWGIFRVFFLPYVTM